ncbi:helix-turn-helix domain-containing protein [Mammaliicoccus sciuri]|uniref:helix-turn-helix domain-containing protein n=1 Tax=Mammaliicoccus sciuri TaxID=1296 RepID=UPI001E3961D0|nr:helix-turn-helix domain-containing protein [Mammaliicoccus sciuri]MCD8810004.1 helix-turn-helix domain-containing protein [Mammaliicoccus sciuri]MEB7394296.1 helix-turn-helix domain-containing protein [Mammaliicoccus sciuri]
MFLTVKETAELLRMSERQVYKLIQQNVIPHIKIKGKILVDREELLLSIKHKEDSDNAKNKTTTITD